MKGTPPLKFLIVNQTPFGDRFLPLGVLKVGTAIQRALQVLGLDGEVKILDPIGAMESKSSFERFVSTLADDARTSMFVGFSDFTFYSEEPLKTFINVVREAHTNAIIALGGWGPTLNPAQYASRYNPDVIVQGTFGEALEVIQQIVGALVKSVDEVKARRLKALSTINGLYIDKKSTGPVKVTSSHDPVNWDLESFSLDSSDYSLAEQETSRFPYEVRKSELSKRDLLVPYQFFRVSCPNHWRRRGCSFCAMAEQAHRLHEQSRLPTVLHQIDREAVIGELCEIRQRYGLYRLHLFIVDDSMTARTIRAVKELLFESELIENLYLVSIFVRPDVINNTFRGHLEELGQAGIKIKLFVGLDFMVQRLNDISSTRKQVDRYDELVRSLESQKHVEVVYSFIQNHPRMTPDELREHLDAVKRIAFSTKALISIAPFIFLLDTVETSNERVPIIYRGYYLSEAVRKLFGAEPMPMIERFDMTGGELVRSLEVIDEFIETLGEELEGKHEDEIALANARQLRTFLPIMREYFLWQLSSTHQDHVEAQEQLKAKIEALPPNALARR